MTATETTSTGFGATLKDSTWDLHQEAESGDLQKRLVKGELGKHEYAAHLGQLYLVHKTLEARLDEACDTCPHVKALNADNLRHVPNLETDLVHLGLEPSSVEDFASTKSFTSWIDETAKTDPTALIGVQYVLEGSTNGNGYIAKKIGPALGLDGDGIRYLVSYGAEQRETWMRFKGRLDTLPMDQESKQRVIAAARRTFVGVRDINLQLLEVLAGHAHPA